MENLTLEHDQLQQNLLDNDGQHPLMARIDRWQVKSMEKVRQVANDGRQELRNSIDQLKKEIKVPLDSIADEIRKKQQTKAFTDIDLTTWANQLQQLKDQLENLPMIKIFNDEDETSSTHLPLIQVQMIQENTGK